MSTIITRSTGSNPKGAPLTAGELDSNFINLNADKVESTRAVNTTAGDLTGGGDLSGDRTLGLASTGISAGTVNNSTTQLTPLILDIKGRVTGVGTPQTITPAFSSLTGKPTTLAGYGITDAQATITGAATTIDTEDLSALKVLVSNASGKVAASDISTTTLGYLDATSSVQGQLDSKQATTAKNAANGYAGLDANAKLPTSLLPALAISEYLGSVANQAARLALTGQKGDWCSQTSDGKVYVITGDDPTDNANWTALTYPVTPGITLNGTSIAPGDTANISAATTNTLTIGTGLTGTSFNGSSAVTIAIDSSVVTLTGTQTLTNKTLTSPAISGGTANNVAIGGTTPAAGNFTTLGATGNVTLGDASGDTLTINAGTTTFAGTGQRITGDFSNTTLANRLMFQTSTVNSGTSIGVLPNGTSTGANLNLFGDTDPANSSIGQLVNSGTEVRLGAITTGTGTYLPMTFYTGGIDRVKIDTSGNVGIGLLSPTQKLDLFDATTVAAEVHTASYGVRVGANSTFGGYIGSPYADTTIISANQKRLVVTAAGNYEFKQNSNAANTSVSFNTTVQNALTLDSGGNLHIGKLSNGANTLGNTFGLCSAGVGYNESVNTTTSTEMALWYINRQSSTGAFFEFRYAISSVGNITTNGTTITFSGNALSDARRKTDISKIYNAISAIDALDFVTFNFKDSGRPSAGVVAQQAETVEQIKPFVISGATEDDYIAFDYDALLGYMGAAIQELHAEIEQLKQRIN